jgi:DNA recombination protein Rad52
MSDAPETPQSAAGLLAGCVKDEPSLHLFAAAPETKHAPAFRAPAVAFGNTPFTAQEAHQIGRQLAIPLSKKDVRTRPGPGGKPLTYLEGWRAIDIANSIFGFDGWSSQLVSLDVRSCRQTSNKRWNACVMATMRITLRNGTFHEDRGGGIAENKKTEEEAQMAAEKEAITDACKRALKNFGRRLGLSLYSDEHLRILNSKASLVPLPQRAIANPQQQNDTRCLPQQHSAHAKPATYANVRDKSQPKVCSSDSGVQVPRQTFERRDQTSHMQQRANTSFNQHGENHTHSARALQMRGPAIDGQQQKISGSNPGHRQQHNQEPEQGDQSLQMQTPPLHQRPRLPHGQIQGLHEHKQSVPVPKQDPLGQRISVQNVHAVHVANPPFDGKVASSSTQMQFHPNQQGLNQALMSHSRNPHAQGHARNVAVKNELGLMRPPLPVASTSISSPAFPHKTSQCGLTRAQDSVYRQNLESNAGNEDKASAFRCSESTSVQVDPGARALPGYGMSPVTPHAPKANNTSSEATSVKSAALGYAMPAFTRTCPDAVERDSVGCKRPLKVSSGQVPSICIPLSASAQGATASANQRNSVEQPSKFARIETPQTRNGEPTTIPNLSCGFSKHPESFATAQDVLLSSPLANGYPADPRQNSTSENRNQTSSESIARAAGSSSGRNEREVEELCAIWASDMS